MADPTLGYDFEDMILRVAEYLGVAYYGSTGSSAATIPVDAHDLDLCKRIVNEGYHRFISESNRWNFLLVPFTIRFVAQSEGTATGGSTTTLVDSSLATSAADDDKYNGYGIRIVDATDSTVATATVTDYDGATGTFTFAAIGFTVVSGDEYKFAPAPAVGGENWRYYLPDDFAGIVDEPLTYETRGSRIKITQGDEATIREARAGAEVKGTPSLFAVRPVDTTTSSDGDRWEVLFYPAPDVLETVTGMYRRHPNQLVNNDDKTVCGFQHDKTVLAAALAEAERLRTDTIGPHEAAYQTQLRRSFDLDSRSKTRRMASYGDRSDDRHRGRPDDYFGVSTYNGVKITY